MRRFAWCFVLLGMMMLCPAIAQAGFTETLPKGTFMVEATYIYTEVKNAWNKEGKLGPIIEPMERFEITTGELLGTLVPEVEASYDILVNLLQYGVLDNWTMVIGIPVVLHTKVDPKFGWIPGDDTAQWGVFETVDTFWKWAAKYGQPAITKWEGNDGVLSDIVLATRLRFTDWISQWFEKHGLAGALTVYGALPTGALPDPEEVVIAGTSSWNLHFQGEIGIHLSADYTLKSLENRVTLGVDVFHEIFLAHEYEAAKGTKNPVILKDEVKEVGGPTYKIDPGDFTGVSGQIDVVPFYGPTWATWLSKQSIERASEFPPLLTLSFRFTHTHLGQTDWQTSYPGSWWEWEDKEEIWQPGYKNILTMQATVSLFRMGIPLQVYGGYRNQSWIPGKNYRAANVTSIGFRFPLKFW